MSNTYFCFSNECDCYKPHMMGKPLKVHPFYIRSTLIMNSNEWKVLNTNFKSLKAKYNIPIKWTHIWSLRNLQTNKKPVPEKADFKLLESFDYRVLIEFIEESLNLVNVLKEKKIILIYTKNSNNHGTKTTREWLVNQIKTFTPQR